MSKVRRTVRSEFGVRKKHLPQNLFFLEGVKFHSVTEHMIEGKRQVRIEFLPRSLKSIVALANQAEELIKEKSEFLEKIELLTRENSEVKDKIAALEKANQQLMENLDKSVGAEKQPHSSIKGCLQVAKERGLKVHGPVLRGGLPGLGKKK